MADYEKLRRKREAEATLRLENERREKRLKEEQRRQQTKREQEQRVYDAMGLEKQKERHKRDIAESTRRNQEIAHLLDKKKNTDQSSAS